MDSKIESVFSAAKLHCWFILSFKWTKSLKLSISVKLYLPEWYFLSVPIEFPFTYFSPSLQSTKQVKTSLSLIRNYVNTWAYIIDWICTTSDCFLYLVQTICIASVNKCINHIPSWSFSLYLFGEFYEPVFFCTDDHKRIDTKLAKTLISHCSLNRSIRVLIASKVNR